MDLGVKQRPGLSSMSVHRRRFALLNPSCETHCTQQQPPPAKKRDLTLPENLMIEAEDKEALVQAHNEMDERLKAFEGGKRKSATELKELRASANLDKAEAAAVAPESPTCELDAKLSKAKSRSEPLKRMSSYRTTG